MRSLSLASRQVRPASRSSSRDPVGFCHGLPTRYPAVGATFPVIAASGVAVLAVLAVGAGHVALHQIALRGERGCGPRPKCGFKLRRVGLRGFFHRGSGSRCHRVLGQGFTPAVDLDRDGCRFHD